MFLNIPALKSIYSGFLIILLGQNLDRVTLVFLLGLSTLSVSTTPPVPAPPQALTHTLAPKSCDDNYCARKSPHGLSSTFALGDTVAGGQVLLSSRKYLHKSHTGPLRARQPEVQTPVQMDPGLQVISYQRPPK